MAQRPIPYLPVLDQHHALSFVVSRQCNFMKFHVNISGRVFINEHTLVVR